jgi:hypothetical protein
MTELKTAQFTDAATVNTYLFGGEATVTLVSKKTKARYTYCVEESKDGKMFWVRTLNGPDNVNDYVYLGFFRAGEYVYGRKSRVGEDAPSAKAFDYFAACLKAGRLGDHLEVWHDCIRYRA